MQDIKLEHRFSKELGLLKNLFGKNAVEPKLSRLNEILRRTEQWWSDNLSRIPGRRVRYLMICEAPPWHEEGGIVYVYNPDSRPKGRDPMTEIHKAFFPDERIAEGEYGRALDKIANEGVLIVDSLPFAMDYGNKRSEKEYSRLVKACVESYLEPKLQNAKIEWHGDSKIAFSLKKNAYEVMKSVGHSLTLGSEGQEVGVTESNIGADGSGYPSAREIQRIFGLNGYRTA